MGGIGIIKNNSSTNEFVSFLKSSKTQYKNLTKKEEREMIEKYRNTDDEKLRNLLVLHNMRYVFSLAKKYSTQTADFDDMIANGLKGLMIASRKFEYEIIDKDTGEKKEIKFNTYATWWILKYMRREFNEDNEPMNSGNTVSINKSVGTGKDNSGESCTMENYLNDIIAPECVQKTIEDELSSNEMSEVCKEIYRFVQENEGLSATEKRIFFDSFVNMKKTKDIAEEVGTNMTNVTVKKKKILNKVRTMLSNRFNIRSLGDLKAC